jgi:hypothetical protein
MNASGMFVVSYNRGGDVYAETVDAAGFPIQRMLIAGTNQVENDSSVAIDANGDFVVTYTLRTNPSQVLAHWVSNNGFSPLLPIPVGWAGNDEYGSSVDMAADGRFVVAYTYQYNANDSDVYAQEFSYGGAAVGPAFAVASSSSIELEPTVAMDSAGDFAVGYAWFGANVTTWQGGKRYTF